jgi:two-component system, NtrC family, nitrogen regulation sensor histidine kinase NtrY
MFIGALLVSLVPALFMFLFSFLLMNRSIDRWFSQPALDVRDDSTRIATELSHYASLNARAEAEGMARSPQLTAALGSGDDGAVLAAMRTHQVTLQGGFLVLYRDASLVAAYQLPQTQGPAKIVSWVDGDDSDSVAARQPIGAMLLKAAERSDEPMLMVGGSQYALGTASLPDGSLIVAGLPMPSGLNAIMNDLTTGTSQYWALYRQRRIIRMTYFLLLLMLTALVFFASSWLALFVSRQMTRPLEALADATVEIGKGDYSHRVTVEATAEMAELVRSFNHMAADLEQSRLLAESSARELSAANQALDERRKELETILETIPSGVVTLDASRRIVLGNRAFADLVRIEGQDDLSGVPLESLLPPEFTQELIRLERRARRMGNASSEVEMRTPRGPVNLSVTLAALDFQGGQSYGSILVLEDVSDFLHAQRQAAWKEVAQRVAHEIRNPLTPITLSAERIRRHVDRDTPESPGVIRKCCDVILGSVETMRTLVGQFAALAEFPVAHPLSSDLNEIVESALMLFEGRIQGIRVEKHLDAGLPPVMADPEALRRAVANLIDNAAEAMHDSLLRVLSIATTAGERPGMAEIVVADTGPGITDDMRERLFLPWFSTRQRGTGLGLSIVAKIVQDHGGSIRVENNVPAGARFIIELPLAETNGSDHPAATLTKAI